MATNDAPERREKVVMFLGLAAVILFSANLLAMVARHFWPNMPVIGERQTEAVIIELEAPTALSWDIQTDNLERDLLRLERRMEHERAALNVQRQSVVRLRSHMAGARFHVRMKEALETKIAAEVVEQVAPHVISVQRQASN